MEITQTTINFILGIVGILSAIFTAYHFLRNPQIKTDQDSIKIKEHLESLERKVKEIEETHLKNVDADLKALTSAVNDLSKTVAVLSTIINERIPKGSPNLTPPGL